MLFLITWASRNRADDLLRHRDRQRPERHHRHDGRRLRRVLHRGAFTSFSLRRQFRSGDPLWTALREEYVSKPKSYKTFAIQPTSSLGTFAGDPLYSRLRALRGAVESSSWASGPLTNLT